MAQQQDGCCVVHHAWCRLPLVVVISARLRNCWSRHHYWMAVSLIRHKPATCPFGHDLTDCDSCWVSWMPCMCGPVRETREAEPLRGGGHVLMRCKACSGDRTDAVYYEPPHDLRQRYP
jgi:hypothetical protein